MTMRIIKDSDDEIDSDLDDEVPPAHSDASPTQHLEHASRSGTGSTESLKKAIQEAHRTHLQTQPKQKEPRSSMSLPEYPRANEKTIGEGTTRNGIELQESVSFPQNQPISNEPTNVNSYNSAIRLAGARLNDDLSRSIGVSGPVQNVSNSHTYQTTTALFPEPSSTVPNATFTQQRILERVVAPTMLGEDSEAQDHHYEPPPEPSIPWSDLMKFSPVNTGEHTESSDRGQITSNMASTISLPSQLEGQESKLSQRSRRDSLDYQRVTPLKNNAQPQDANMMERMLGDANFSSTHRREFFPTAFPESNRSATKKSIKTSHRGMGPVMSTASSDDDIALVDITKEQYKPRPTRSRSLKLDPKRLSDCSVLSEKLRVSKRRRTTSATDNSSAVTTPQKIQLICEMGFTPSSTEKALKQNNGDVGHTIDWLVSNGAEEDELAQHNTPKRKRTLKAKKSSSKTEYEATSTLTHQQYEDRRHAAEILLKSIEEGMETSAPTLQVSADNKKITSPTTAPNVSPSLNRNPKVQVIIPKKSPKVAKEHNLEVLYPSSEKDSREQLTMGEMGLESFRNEHTQFEVVRGKKRGKGRPTKAASAVMSGKPSIKPEHSGKGDKNDEVEEKEEKGEEGLLMESHTTAPEVTSVDVQVDSPANDAGRPKNENSQDTATLPLTQTPAITSIRTPEISTKPGSNSPNNRGKVPYRVGLSKRARIAPLLRMVKK